MLPIERILPYNAHEPKSVQITRMFNDIAPHYDRLNQLLSLGLHKHWRRAAVQALTPFAPNRILDLATGTGDLAIDIAQLLQPKSLIAGDLSPQMLNIAQQKARKAHCQQRIHFQRLDAHHLPFPDNSFDAITLAFGLRNFQNIPIALQQIRRTLQPNAPLILLELSTPTNPLLRTLHRLYSRLIPPLGQLFSHNSHAYRYLPASIRNVPQGNDMRQLLQQQGFTHLRTQTLSLGLCSLYTALKPSP